MPVPLRHAGRPALALLMLAAVPTARALDYNPALDYPASCVVNYKQEVFRTKWWTPAGHTPDEIETAPNPWDTSWEKVTNDTPTGCSGDQPGNPGGPGGPGEPPREVLLSQLSLIHI